MLTKLQLTQNSNIICARDYCFIFNKIQKFALDTDIMEPFSSDYPPILISFSKEKQNKNSGFGKFNNSLLSDDNFKEKLKQYIQNIKNDIELSNDP